MSAPPKSREFCYIDEKTGRIDDFDLHADILTDLEKPERAEGEPDDDLSDLDDIERLFDLPKEGE